jgi:hypothetical protein
MLHSETFARAVHADRMRDLEREAKARLLLAPVEPPAPLRITQQAPRTSPTIGRGPCADSAGVPGQVPTAQAPTA